MTIKCLNLREVKMTYSKKHRKGKKIVAIAMSMAMLGTSTIPYINEGGFLSGVSYAETSESEENIWQHINVMPPDYSDEYKFYFDQDFDKKKAKEIIKKIKYVFINEDKYSIKEFETIDSPYYGVTLQSKADKAAQHKKSYKKVDDANLAKYGLELTNGEIHKLSYKVEKNPDGESKVTPEYSMTKPSTGVVDSDTEEPTLPKPGVDDKVIPEDHLETKTYMWKKTSKNGGDYDAISCGFDYYITNKKGVLKDYMENLSSIVINGTEFPISEFITDKYGGIYSSEDYASEHVKKWDRVTNRNTIIIKLKDGRYAMWKSPAQKAFESSNGEKKENSGNITDKGNEQTGEAINTNTSKTFENLKIENISVDKENQVYQIKLSGYSKIGETLGYVNDTNIFWLNHMQTLLKSVEIDGYTIPYSYTENRRVAYSGEKTLLTVQDPHLSGFTNKNAHRVVLKFHSAKGDYYIQADKTKDDGEIVFQQKGYIAPEPGEAEKAAREYEKK